MAYGLVWYGWAVGVERLESIGLIMIMPPRSRAQGNFSIPSRDNAEGAGEDISKGICFKVPSAIKVRLRGWSLGLGGIEIPVMARPDIRVPIPDSTAPRRVLPVPTSPHRASRAGKIFMVMYATDSEGVEFVVYQLKDMAYQFKEWEATRGDDADVNLEAKIYDGILRNFLWDFNIRRGQVYMGPLSTFYNSGIHLRDSSIDHLEPRVSLDKGKVMPNVEMRDADKAPAASEEKLLLSKFYLDEIKSFVRTYVDMKFNDLQKLMVNQYTGFLGVVKDCFASFGKHTADAKSYNVVDVAGQSSKLGVNEGPNEESLKHIEVVFYYLRKKAKMDTTSEYRYTTVNCIFMNYIYDTYTQYHQSHSEIDLSSHVENIRSMKVASVDRSICEIMQGLCISAGIPCHLIDEVYVPINCKGSFHWVLAVIVLKKRCIRVYDSMKGHRGHADEIKEHAEMLSTYLTISDFFEKEDRTDWSFLDVYKEKMD
ncbi:putative protein EIN4-like [Capsicum annuum]|nr:putative protein EIN4-like [Capsicum annuum]